MTNCRSTQHDGRVSRIGTHILWIAIWLIVCTYLFVSCDAPTPVSSSSSACRIEDELREGARRDQIRALNNPAIVGPRSDEAQALGDNDRVIGLLKTGTPLAIPHSVLYSHEIANIDDWNGQAVSVTFCPLTASSVAFTRDAVQGATFGVSGLLYKNNLVMYDRTDGESLWPQMQGFAICGARRGASLDRVPVIEMRWKRWVELYPSTRLMTERDGSETGRSYTHTHEHHDTTKTEGLRSRESAKDDRPVPTGRVLGLPTATRVGSPESPGSGGGTAFPFRQLTGPEPYSVVNLKIEGKQAVILWDRAARAAMAYRTASTFKVEDGRIVDVPSGSIWAVDGRAVDGPRFGDRLKPISEAFVADAKAWHDFFPSSTFWSR